MLGAQPIHGRLFRDEEERPGAGRVVILSEEIWKHRFGGDASVVGRPITLNGVPHAVAGVVPAVFRFPPVAQIWCR